MANVGNVKKNILNIILSIKMRGLKTILLTYFKYFQSYCIHIRKTEKVSCKTNVYFMNLDKHQLVTTQ